MFSVEGRRAPTGQRRLAPSVLHARLQPLALEPRLLFDGAAVATADVAGPAPGGSPAGSGIEAGDAALAGGEASAPAEGVAPGFDAALLSAAPDGAEPVAISVHKGAFADAASLLEAVQAGAETVGEADLAGVDAGDTVHYAVTVSNRGTGYAYDLQVQDQLPDQLSASAVRNLRLLDASGVEMDYSGGSVLRNAASGERITSGSEFAAALFNDCAVEFVDPGRGEGYLGGSCTGSRPETVTIAYEVTLPGTVIAGSALCNQASAVQVALAECGNNLVDTCAPPADTAAVTIDGATLVTRLTGTSQAHTAGTDAVIGEILCYETVITVPEGCSPAAVLTQQLAPGLSLVSIDSIVYSEGVRASSAPAADSIVPESADGGQANRFVLRFGDIGNGNRDNGTADTITVTFRAVTGNVWSNQQGRELVAEAVYRSGDGTPAEGGQGTARVELTAAAVPVGVVEPVLNVTVVPDGAPVEAGGLAEFVITIGNDSGIDAFDVTVDDIALPPGLQLHPQSWEPGQAAGRLTAVLAAGERISHRLVTVVAQDAAVGEALSVDVQVRYTSLPEQSRDCDSCAPAGGSRDLSPFVQDSDRERTGDDGPAGLDDHVAADTGSVLPVSAQPDCPPPPCEPPPPSVPPLSALPPSVPPPSVPPLSVSPPSAPPPSASPPFLPAPVSPPSAPSRPGLLLEDRWTPARGLPLADLFSHPLPPLEIGDAFARLPPPGLHAEDFGLPPELSRSPAVEKVVAQEDDCIPVQPPDPKPKPIPAKPRVFGDAVKPQRFSEQIGAAKRRLSPTVVRPLPEC